MSTQNAKKKRFGSRRRVTNQNKTNEADEFLVTDSTSVAQHSIPEENKKSVNAFADTDTSVSQTQNPPSPELTGNRRKLGSSRRKKGGRHVEDSTTESHHRLREEVEEKIRGNESSETTQMSLAFQPEEEEHLSKGYEHDVSGKQEGLSYLSVEELSSVYSVKEKESKYTEENTEVLKQDGALQSDSLLNESNVESEATQFSAPPVETTEKNSPKEDTEIEYNVRQETFSSTNDELSTKEEENEIFNLSDKDAQHSDDVSNFTEEMKKTQMYGIHNNNERLMHEINATEIISDNLLDQVELTLKSTDDESTKQEGSSPDDKNDEQHKKKNPFEAFDDMTEGYYVYDAEKPPTSDTDRPDTEVGQLNDKEGRLDYHIRPSDQQTFNQKTVHTPAGVNLNNPSLQMSQSEIETPFDSLLQVSFVTKDEHNDAGLSPTGSRRKLGSSHENKQGRQVEDSDGDSCCKPTQEVEENISGNKELETPVSLPIEVAMQEKSVESALEEMTNFNTSQSGKLSSQVKENLHFFVIADESSPLEHSENEWSVEKATCPSPKEELSTIEEQREMFTLFDVKSTHQREEAVNTAREPEVETPQSHEIHPSSENLIHDVTEYSDFFSGHLINQDEVIDQFGSTVKKTDDIVTKQENVNPDDTKAKHPKEENKPDAFDEDEGPQIGEKEKVDTALGQVYEMEGKVEDDMKLISEQTGHLEKDGLFIEIEESKSFQTLQSDIQEEDMEMTMDYESLETTIVETDVEGNPIETTLTEIDMFDKAQTEEVSCQVKHNADVSTLIDVSGPTSLNLRLSSTVDQKLAVQSSSKMPDKELHNLYCLTEKEKSDRETELLRPYVNLQGNYLVDESFLKSEEKGLSLVLETTTENHSPPGDTEPKCSIEHEEFSSQKIDVEQTQIQEIHYSSERVTDDDTDNSAILSGHPTDQVSDAYQLELTVKSTEFANMQKNPDADDNVLHHAEEGILPDVQERKFSLKHPPLDMIAPLDNPPQDYSNSSKEQTQTDSNLIKKRKKMGSSRRYKDRQQDKDSVAESHHEQKEEVNEEQETSQMVLVTERASQEELRQGSYYDTTISETHEDPMFSAILNSGAQSSTISNYPETNLESLFPGSESLQADHSERERHFRVEESDKSMLVNLEGMDTSVFHHNEDVKGAHHSEDDLEEVHEHNVKSTQMQDIQEIDSTAESVLHDSSKNVEIISGNLIKEAEVRNIYESELTVKSTDDSHSKQEDLHPHDKLEEHPIKHVKVEALDQAKHDDHVNDSKKPEQISNTFREDTSPDQANKAEGHVEGEIKLFFEQTGNQEKEGLFFWDEDSESSLQTLPAEMQDHNSQEQQIDWKLEKDSSAESYNRHTEEVVQETGENKQVETTKIPLTVETAKQEKMDTVFSGHLINQDEVIEQCGSPGDTEPICSIEHEEFASQKIDVEQTQMHKIHYSSERVTDDDTENSAILSGHPTDQVSDAYQHELTVKSTEFANMQKNPDADDNVLHHAEEGILPDVQERKFPLKNPPLDMIAPLDNPPQDSSNSSKEQTQTDSNLIKKRKKMGSSRRYKDRQQDKDSVAESHHEQKEEVNEEQETSQMVLVTERASQEELKDEIKLCFEQTGNQEKEGLFFWDEDSESSLQTLPAEMQDPNSQEQQIDWKLEKDSSAESYSRHTEEVVQETGENKQVETTKIPLTVETAKQEKMDTVLEEMQPIDTAQTEEVCDQVKNNDHDCTIVDELNSLHSSLAVDNQTVGQSNVMEMPGEKLTQVCSVSEKENRENDFFRQDGKLQGNYEMSQSAFTQEIPTEKDQPGENPDNESVEQDVSTELSTNVEEKEHVTLSQASVGPHSEATVNEIHEEEIKPTQMQEVYQHVYYTVEESESSFHALQSEMNVPSDSELQQINPIGNSSCHRNRERHHVENTVNETVHEPKEEFEFDIKATSISSEGHTDIYLEPIMEIKENTFTVLSQNLKDNRAIVKTAITSSLSKDDFEEEKKVIDEPENLSQLTEFDKTDLTLSPKESGLKDGLDIENTPCHDDIVFTGSSDPLEQEDDYHIQNEEALSYDKEEKNDMQKTNDAVETVGRVTIDDYNAEASTADGPVTEKDEVDGKLKDPMKTDQQAQDNTASQDITESELFAEHKTDSLVPLDTDLVVNSKAVDMAEENRSDHLREKSKQRKRKFGSNRRTLLKVNTEEGQENKDETRRGEFNTEAAVRDFEKIEVMEEFPALVTAEVSMNEKAKPSLSLVSMPQNKTNETSVLDSSSDPKSLESSMIPDKNLLMPSNTEEYTGITGGSFVSLDETTQGSQNDEERPESANALQHQALKSTEKQVVAVEDLEIVKAVVIGGEEEQNNVKPSIQDLSNVEEGAQKTDFEIKNASPNLNSPQPRRKMGSTRKNLRSKTKEEELPQKQEVDDTAIETTTNAEDVKTSFVSGIQEEELKLPVEQEVIVSVQKKDRVLETVEYSHTGESHLTPKAHQTSEENPVSSSESEHQQTPNDHPAVSSTTSKEDVMSESAAGGRKRKMGSNRKSRGKQNNREATAGEDHIFNSENGSDGGSVTDEIAVEDESLGLPEASGIEKTNEKASANIRTSKAGEDTKPESEKKPEQHTPVQHPSADIRLGQEGQRTFSLAGDSSVNRSKSYNVVMVGDSSVGKTSFMKRAQSGKFSLEIPASVGLDSCLWTVVVDGKPVVLQLWDTAGQERFHSITRQIFHKAQAFLLMYDITSAHSFSAVSYWASCIQEGAPESVTVLLLGNKSDHAERQIKAQEGETLAKEYNFEFMECSAATGENVIESLETIARMLSQKVDTREEATVSFKEPQKKKSSGCC